MRTISTDVPPFSLIEQKSLAMRLIHELEAALGELTRDPRGFFRELVSADSKDAKRSQRIRLGLVCGLLFHVAMIVLIAILGWRTMRANANSRQSPEYRVITEWLLKPEKTEPGKTDTPKGEPGGGGGGQHAPLPPSQGVPPPMMPGPQVVNMNPSNIPDPTLSVSPTIVGPTSEPPPPAPIGDPAGKTGPFSGGPGEKGGIGGGEGTGVGKGKDSGTEPGSRGGKGGGSAGFPEGSGTDVPSVIDFGRRGQFPSYRPWSWIRRQTPVITPDAQQNKVIGTVVLRADFNADGTITNISIAMPVDYMNESAMDALRRSTFNPATIKGVPITVRNVLIRVDVHY
jgi:TonB family protein